MSIFRISHYTGKKQTTYSPKTKLPTESKTKSHKCSQCPRTDAGKFPISEKESRWLCPNCKRKYDNQFNKEKYANFIDAGRLYRSMKNGH